VDKGKQPKKPVQIVPDDIDSSGEELESAEEEGDVEMGEAAEGSEDEMEEEEADEEGESGTEEDDEEGSSEEDDEEEEEQVKEKGAKGLNKEQLWEAELARRKALKAFSGAEESSQAKKTVRPSKKRDELEERENKEENYESRPRRAGKGWQDEEEKHQLLPVKNASGKVIQQGAVKKAKKKEEPVEEEPEGDEDEDDDDDDDDEEEEEEEEGAAAVNGRATGSIAAKLIGVTGYTRVVRAKELLAEHAEQIQSDPENSISMMKGDRLFSNYIVAPSRMRLRIMSFT